jgi:phage tail sheath gpL-like
MAMTGSIISQPSTTITIIGATTAVDNTPQKVLFVGQKTVSGSATSGEIVENVQNNESELNALVGANSMLAAMVRSARELNTETQFDLLPLDDDGGGVDATGAVTVAGTATDDGTVTVAIASEVNHTLEVAVTSGDSAITVADAIRTAIAADSSIPVIGSGATAAVVITAVNAGTLGNDIGISTATETSGITLSITAMSGGSVNPDLTTVLDAVGDTRYQGIVWPYSDIDSELEEITDFLDPRFNTTNNLLDGVAFTARGSDLSTITTQLDTFNSQSLVYFADKFESASDYEASAVFEQSPVKASQFAAIRALRLTDGASISEFVTTSNGALDAFGGPALASKPYFNTPMRELPLVQSRFGWTQTEIETLLDSGGSVLGRSPSGTTALVGEVATTYKFDQSSNPDQSFKFLNFVDTSTNVREYYYNNYRARFAQTRLTEGDIIKGRDMANELTIIAFSEQLYGDLSGDEFVLLQAGEAALTFYKANLTVDLDLSTGTVTITMIVPLVTQLRELLVTMQIAFSTE